ncbi:MAG: aminoglycoside phosphotransferase family protein [Moorea sp. SIO2B7]|nr:aminoglycoside phosphotransferase family protein [Moorena sp. SIO2B7]
MRLSSSNVGDYLAQLNLCHDLKLQIEPVAAKNFNLLVTFSDGKKILVKQERQNQQGKTAGEFQHEWRIQALLQRFPQLDYLRPFLPRILHFDADNSIMVFRYLDQYQDLADFYTKEKSFPTAIASEIGTILATIHRATMKHQEYGDFFAQENLIPNQAPKLISNLERISPEIFGQVPADGLKFFALYQRYDSLGKAIADTGNNFTPCCLTHNDLKLNNILLHTNWKHESNIIRLIDWERSSWGDPGFDLGSLIASYLQIWLSSLVVSQSLSIEESLRLATTPLEQLQPAIASLTIAYLKTFPEIIEHRPDFLKRVVQFTGLALIQQIQAMIQYQKSFGNTGICMLQVAKSLLCRPEQSMSTIFGNAVVEMSQYFHYLLPRN